MSSSEQHRRVMVRPTPRLVPFLVAGVVVAFVAAVVVVLVSGSAEDYTVAGNIGYLTFALSLPGLALAALSWLLLERRSRRLTRTYRAVPADPAPSERTDENGPR
ncbi:hypothetical protein [Nesterenkonia xinjiangensis]|uniref:Uncharacterized protein n=1 Tax=Nesterenkonia xinjiangensis TaxID=225327 RepID=A0A7Z0GLL4_9MICC|nr:hypothetical protein [Nesterenkonia xinjiangensis]NYJ77724.1 hypothetical protein [Nesterenkonia xinjiangensis]